MLELYRAEDWPYCKKVRMALAELGVPYVVHDPRTARKEDVRNEQNQAELVAVGGRDQPPSGVDHERGTTLYESDDIVEHVERHYGRVSA